MAADEGTHALAQSWWLFRWRPSCHFRLEEGAVLPRTRESRQSIVDMVSAICERLAEQMIVDRAQNACSGRRMYQTTP